MDTAQRLGRLRNLHWLFSQEKSNCTLCQKWQFFVSGVIGMASDFGVELGREVPTYQGAVLVDPVKD